MNNGSDLANRDKQRHILLAVDESENSKRAVMYLADFFGDYADVYITLLTVIPEPDEDFFATEEQRLDWLAKKKETIRMMMEGYAVILLGAGFREEQIKKKIIVEKTTSVADSILAEQDKLRCCIVVVGRRGLSHNEEFIYGSTSNKILHHASHCAVMIVE